MPIECLIKFDNNPEIVYYAGQEVSGNVDLKVDESIQIRAICITVSGFVKVRWTKKGNYTKDSDRPVYFSYKQYLCSASYVVGYHLAPPSDLEPGDYTYTFHVVLPKTLPTSFDGQYGHIRYEIVVNLECPKEDIIFKNPFTVIQPLDLNLDPINRTKLEIVDRTKFWSHCCASGPLTVTFSMPYSGFAPGQTINFNLFIKNESAVDCLDSTVELKQQVTYESRHPYRETRHEKVTITSKSYGRILRWSRKDFNDTLDLPSIPPTSFLSCSLISIVYAIVVIIKPSDLHRRLKMKIPITIGTVPVFEEEASPARIISSQPRLHKEMSKDKPPGYLDPPPYEEALAFYEKFVDVDNTDNTIEQPDFTPKYPVYYSHKTPAAAPLATEENELCTDVICQGTENSEVKML